MIFRTEIEPPKRPIIEIDHTMPIFMFGSCFTDNIGKRLEEDGFIVTHNPMGPLYNPSSILIALQLALYPTFLKPLTVLHDGKWRCLNFATKYSDSDAEQLKAKLDHDLEEMKSNFESAKVVIITLGTSFVYEWFEGAIVGNCHKIPPQNFNRRMLTVDEACESLRTIIKLCHGKKVIFTVSPIRHTADTLHGNQLSKAVLLLALNKAIELDNSKNVAIYFPSYEIMLDDLRDYRFYAPDMKHPSPTAVEYIYEVFAKYFLTKKTIEKCRLYRKEYKRNAHNPIFDDAITGD